jgi:Domain of unknown function (DUF4395)
MNETLQTVDHSAIKVNQAFIIVLSILAFILNAAWLVAFVALVMLLGTLLGKPGFFFVYKYVLRPSGLVKPDILMDNPEPHRFAQGFGGLVLAAGSLALFLGVPLLGWALVWLVVALAALNLFAGFCMGCAMYYWLARVRAPGFSKNPPPDTFPGMRPKAHTAQ